MTNQLITQWLLIDNLLIDVTDHRFVSSGIKYIQEAYKEWDSDELVQ